MKKNSGIEYYKSYKTNITGYLSIDAIEKLAWLAREKNTSRNTLFEEAIMQYLEKNHVKDIEF